VIDKCKRLIVFNILKIVKKDPDQVFLHLTLSNIKITMINFREGNIYADTKV